MAVKTMDDALTDELRDMLHAEKQLVKALPKLAKAASDEELRRALTDHLEETKGHVQRLERALQTLGKPVRPKTCDGMKGILEEGDGAVEDAEEGSLRDVVIIASAQKSEHYEIASYGTVIAWAKQVGQNSIAQLLTKTLDEEKAADEKLNELAESLNAQPA